MATITPLRCWDICFQSTCCSSKPIHRSMMQLPSLILRRVLYHRILYHKKVQLGSLRDPNNNNLYVHILDHRVRMVVHEARVSFFARSVVRRRSNDEVAVVPRAHLHEELLLVNLPEEHRPRGVSRETTKGG